MDDKRELLYDECIAAEDKDGGDETSVPDRAHKKLVSLMSCDNERVALAAAKEIMSIYEKKREESEENVSLDVTIKIIENEAEQKDESE